MKRVRPEACDDNESSSRRHSPRNGNGGESSTTAIGFVLPFNLGGSIPRCLWRNGRGSRQRSKSFSSGDGCSSNTDFEDKSNGWEKNMKMYVYHSQLEKDIERLQKELQEESELHATLENAIEHKIPHAFGSPIQLPKKAQELLVRISLLETALGKLERELAVLQHHLHHERSERNIGHSPCRYSPELDGSPHLIKKTMSPCSDVKLIAASDNIDHTLHRFDRPPYKDDFIWLNPNRLSEEMVSCMRDIFLQFSSSSVFVISDNVFSCCTAKRTVKLLFCSIDFSDTINGMLGK